MPPTIHCIRHGQGFHNLGSGKYQLPDPYLTLKGEQQCETVRILYFPDQSDISLVTASPMTRTLHSAYVIFQDALKSNLKCQPEILAIPDSQETSDDPCDIGSEPSILRETAVKNKWPVDLSLVRDGWNMKDLQTRYSPHSDAIRARARDTRIFLREKIRELVKNGDTNVHVALVTHGGFLHFFTEDWEDSWQFPATGWKNCETRAYTFELDPMTDDDEDARIIETEESRKRRQKFKPMFGRDKQPALFDEAMEKWEGQGLQRPDRVGMAPQAEVMVNDATSNEQATNSGTETDLNVNGTVSDGTSTRSQLDSKTDDIVSNEVGMKVMSEPELAPKINGIASDEANNKLKENIDLQIHDTESDKVIAKTKPN